MIILFSQLTSINIENKNIANDKFIKLMIIRNAIYNNYEVVKYDDYTTYASKDNYCVSNEDNEYEDLCIEM